MLALAAADAAWAQAGGMDRAPVLPPSAPQPVRGTVGPQFSGIGERVPIAAIKVVGNELVSESKVLSYIKSKAGRDYNADVVEQDVRTLGSSGLFTNIRTFQERTPEGIVLTFQVFERPTIRYIKFVGNDDIPDATLLKKSGLAVREALNLYAVDEAVAKIEDYYHSVGYANVTVAVHEGNKPSDKGVVFIINEGNQRNIWATSFVGNTIVSGARLRTQISSVPATMWLFGGKLDMRALEEDCDKLTAYYRALGYFKARVGRELQYHASGNWVTITFVIDEGPRYKVRNVSYIGNKVFATSALELGSELKPGDDYIQDKLNKELARLRDLYGSQGYVFADIKCEPRFGIEPGVLDLVYDIQEGEQYRVGQIHVRIDGDYPHTRRSVVLNRLSLRPGDIIDIRELRASERRIRASQLFEDKPQMGMTPRIVVRPPGSLHDESRFAAGADPDEGEEYQR